MAKKHRNLIGKICEPVNLMAAYQATARGRRGTDAYLEFKDYDHINLECLAGDMAAGAYRQGPLRNFTVYEPKPRLISALSFRDRVAQHALVNIIGPIFEAGFLPRSFACRAGFGTHRGVKAVQSDMRRMLGGGKPLYVLKTDFSKYFPSIDLSILNAMIRRKISCAATLRLIESMVPPDGQGIPIGCLTSQLFANVYGSAVDRFIHHDCEQRHWFRYMDDIVVLGHDHGALVRLKDDIAWFAKAFLGLRLSKWSVATVGRGINFLGYRIWSDRKLLRRVSVKRARRRLKELAVHGCEGDGERFAAAWAGHARWANSHNLLVSLRLDDNEIRWPKDPKRPERWYAGNCGKDMGVWWQ